MKKKKPTKAQISRSIGRLNIRFDHIENLATLLETIEWSGPGLFTGSCPACKARKPRRRQPEDGTGHRKDCWLQMILWLQSGEV